MILLIYYAYLNTIKYYTVQVTNLYTDASDSQNNHTELDNIIQMQMTPKIITIRYIIIYKVYKENYMFPTAEYYPDPDVYRSDHPRDQ